MPIFQVRFLVKSISFFFLPRQLQLLNNLFFAQFPLYVWLSYIYSVELYALWLTFSSDKHIPTSRISMIFLRFKKKPLIMFQISFFKKRVLFPRFPLYFLCGICDKSWVFFLEEKTHKMLITLTHTNLFVPNF